MIETIKKHEPMNYRKAGIIAKVFNIPIRKVIACAIRNGVEYETLPPATIFRARYKRKPNNALIINNHGTINLYLED